MDKALILNSALETLDIERKAIEDLRSFLDESFVHAVECLHLSGGRVIVSGIGKSAIIAQKIVATFNSTGTPAIFMHAADAIHGDLGMMQADDVAIVISKSGESAEIRMLVPLIRNFGNKLIAICGKRGSFLATQADHFIDTTVEQEACPNQLAPTSSTTAQLVMGDALAVCLLRLKGFTAGDFAKYHPGGTLGKQLYLTCAQLAAQHEKPCVHEGDRIAKVIVEITEKRLGAAVVLNGTEQICGIITDGDIRRMLEKHNELGNLSAKDIMNADPKRIEGRELAVHALALMRKKNITQVVVTEEGQYSGILHLHDLLREGLI